MPNQKENKKSTGLKRRCTQGKVESKATETKTAGKQHSLAASLDSKSPETAKEDGKIAVSGKGKTKEIETKVQGKQQKSAPALRPTTVKQAKVGEKAAPVPKATKTPTKEPRPPVVKFKEAVQRSSVSQTNITDPPSAIDSIAAIPSLLIPVSITMISVIIIRILISRGHVETMDPTITGPTWTPTDDTPRVQVIQVNTTVPPRSFFEDMTLDEAVPFILVGSLIVGIPLMTVVVVLCHKYDCTKLFTAYLYFVITMALSFFSLIVLYQVLPGLGKAVDIISILFLIYNYAVVGCVSLFYRGPLLLQQFYQISFSITIALFFTDMLRYRWLSWCFLGLLVLWDIIAVLPSWGPLRILIEVLHEKGHTMSPALIYSTTMMWDVRLMALEEKMNKEPSRRVTKDEEVEADLSKTDRPLKIGAPTEPEKEALLDKLDRPAVEEKLAGKKEPGRSPKPSKALPVLKVKSGRKDLSQAKQPPGKTSEVSKIVMTKAAKTEGPSAMVIKATKSDQEEKELKTAKELDIVPKEGTVKEKSFRLDDLKTALEAESVRGSTDGEPRGPKLGLGDFIFYSFLIALSMSLDDWNRTLACFMSIITGLLATLVILMLLKRPLPALPLSLTLGIIAFFATWGLITPFIDELTENQVFI